MSKPLRYCAFCGRLTHRCSCADANSDAVRFFSRGGRSFQPRSRSAPYQRAVPPQVKRRERAKLRAARTLWYGQLVAAQGECCVNCGESEGLVLDHVLPIAKGGLSRLDNLQLLCATCNRIKGKLVIDFRRAAR